MGVRALVAGSSCSVTIESAREDATQTMRESGRKASARGPCTSVESTQPGVAGLPVTQATRVSAPVAASRRNVSTASLSVPAAATVVPSGETATADARASPPIGVQSL